jgi:hypothetical protein
LNFEFLLVLNHNDVTWGYQEGEVLGKMGLFLGTILRRVGGVVGIL